MTTSKKIIWHNHHLWPQHAIGPAPKNNLLRCNVAMHAFMHKLEYERWGRWQDNLAYEVLSGIKTCQETVHEAQVRGGKMRVGPRGPYRKDRPHGNVGKKRSLEYKLSRTGEKRSEEARKKMSESAKRRSTPEYRKLMSERAKLLWTNPKYACNSPEYHQALTERLRRNWADPASGFNRRKMKQK